MKWIGVERVWSDASMKTQGSHDHNFAAREAETNTFGDSHYIALATSDLSHSYSGQSSYVNPDASLTDSILPVSARSRPSAFSPQGFLQYHETLLSPQVSIPKGTGESMSLPITSNH